MAKDSIDWLVTAALVDRIGVVPLCLAAGAHVMGPVWRVFIPAAVVLGTVNLALAVGMLAGWVRRSHVASRRTLQQTTPNRAVRWIGVAAQWSSRWTRAVLNSPVFFAVDIAATAALTVWVAVVVAPNTLLLPYQDVFGMYLMGTLALWTAMRGWKIATMLMGASAALTAVTILVNYDHAPGLNLIQGLGRSAWMASAVGLPLVGMRVARIDAGLARDDAALMSGTLAREKIFETLHGKVLVVLAWIMRLAPDRLLPIRHRQQTIHAGARRAIDDAAGALSTQDGHAADFRDQLHSLVDTFALRGFTVGLDLGDLQLPPEQPPVIEVLVQATHAALDNAFLHSGTSAAMVTVSDATGAVRITIGDLGHGFDLTQVTPRHGTTTSIQERMARIAGCARVDSVVGQGTTVTLDAPLRKVAFVGHLAIRPTDPVKLGGGRELTFKQLLGEAVRWFVLAALAYRIALSPLQIAATIANLGWNFSTTFLVVIPAVFAFDLLLYAAVIKDWFPKAVTSTWLLIIDVSITAGLNLWCATLLAPGTELRAGNEIFWGYTLGVVAFWTGLRGLKVGAGIVAGGLVLQLAMARINGQSLDADALAQLLTRQLLLALAAVLAAVMVIMARRSAIRTLVDSIAEGQTSTRVWQGRHALRDLTTPMATIAERTSPDLESDEGDMTEIRGLALEANARLREDYALNTPPGVTDPRNVFAELAAVARQARLRGLLVELYGSKTATADPAIITALGEAVAEALANVTAHSGTASAIVHIGRAEGPVAVTVRDYGSGFRPLDPSCPLPSVAAKLDPIGGTVDVWSTPTEGSLVTLRAPRRR